MVSVYIDIARLKQELNMKLWSETTVGSLAEVDPTIMRGGKGGMHVI